jgi:hypothetical protein
VGGVSAAALTPRAVKALIATEVASAICGFIGGIPLTIDPTGKLLGMPLEHLKGLPIQDFFLPGLWLLIVFGVGLSVTAYGLWAHRPWSYMLALTLGVVWIGWVSFELYLWGPDAVVAVWFIFPLAALYLLSRGDSRNYLTA